MIVLTAAVRRTTSATHHAQLVRDEKGRVEISPIQGTVSLDIDVGDDGVFLLHRDTSGECIADTWHVSVEDAKQQALFEFLVQEDDWIVVKGT